MLTQLRLDVSEALVAGGLKSAEYVAETITPPIAVVVPGAPYIVTSGEGVPFGHVRVRHDVLLVSHRGANKKAAALIDSMIETALAALNDYDVTDVAQPGLVELSGSKFMGSVVSIEQIVKEP